MTGDVLDKMYSEEMYGYVAQSSVIREIFSYGLKRKEEIGSDKVFDFSLGNPSTPPPKNVTETMEKLLMERPPLELHGYTPAAGAPGVRKAISDDLNDRFNITIRPENLYMTCGAAFGYEKKPIYHSVSLTLVHYWLL